MESYVRGVGMAHIQCCMIDWNLYIPSFMHVIVWSDVKRGDLS